ncbi:hypothetical protein TNCV_1275321 [Trichonephila clavipes]|nr:hypothetical protein TNCV_1275321 [Trichonephila clavipes]
MKTVFPVGDNIYQQDNAPYQKSESSGGGSQNILMNFKLCLDPENHLTGIHLVSLLRNRIHAATLPSQYTGYYRIRWRVHGTKLLISAFQVNECLGGSIQNYPIGAVSSTNNVKRKNECGLPSLESRKKLATIKFTNKIRSCHEQHTSNVTFRVWKAKKRLKRSSTLQFKKRY